MDRTVHVRSPLYKSFRCRAGLPCPSPSHCRSCSESNYHLGIAHQVLIFIILALGYDVLLGFTGFFRSGISASLPSVPTPVLSW